nr:MAG TPA: hypothetical protein [Caudoviricetes sp.]
MSVRPRNRIFRFCYNRANREFHEKGIWVLHSWISVQQINLS